MAQDAEPKTVMDEILNLLSENPEFKPKLVSNPRHEPKLIHAPKPPKEKYHNGNRGPDERRVAPDKKRTFEVSEMWDVHHEIVRRLLIGQKVVNIARDLGVSEAMVSYTRNSPIVREKLEIMKGARDAETLDLAKRIRENAPQSLKLLEDIISGEVDGVPIGVGLRAKEANTMLARSGFGPVQNIKGAIVHGHYTSDEIDEIKRRAVEDGLKSGLVVEGEVVEMEAE